MKYYSKSSSGIQFITTEWFGGGNHEVVGFIHYIG
jgi:hypothetical protein